MKRQKHFHTCYLCTFIETYPQNLLNVNTQRVLVKMIKLFSNQGCFSSYQCIFTPKYFCLQILTCHVLIVLFTYLFLAVLGLHCCVSFSLVEASGGHPPRASLQRPPHCGAGTLDKVGPTVVAMGAVTLQHVESPGPGMESTPPVGRWTLHH